MSMNIQTMNLYKCTYDLNGECQLLGVPCAKVKCELKTECLNCPMKLQDKTIEPCCRCDALALKDDVLLIYTDGAASMNGKKRGFGGWAYKLIYKNTVKTEAGKMYKATSNQAEMMAALKAMKAVRDKSIPTILYSDSTLVVNVLSDIWTPRSNMDLWRGLFKQRDRFKDIVFIWVKGHSGNAHNEDVDREAKKAAGLDCS